MALLFIGTTEIILIALVILLLFGGRKIPELMRGMGKGVKSFKDGMNGKDEEDTPIFPDNTESGSDQPDDGDNAFAVLRRKAAQFRRESDVRKRKAKAVRCLVGRGFSYEDAIEAADRWMREEGTHEE